ncbi:MAG: hypothetical protein KC917_22720, partial [Candidatus Omnitrophica bacterium]|nr:hypothetical protein [Candidatus Omnitrophota bacterium]
RRTGNRPRRSSWRWRGSPSHGRVICVIPAKAGIQSVAGTLLRIVPFPIGFPSDAVVPREQRTGVRNLKCRGRATTQQRV